MKRIILSLCLFIFIRSEAQQINPVPDYVFSNKMSVGRNAVTDTAAYFSIGPRYGAVRGFMPPMVTDTATITTGKRNGLTIFSIQKNKYMYWDSVRVQWSDFAGSSGAYIFATDTASMLSPYIRAAGYALSKSGQTISADTSLLSTRAWRKKGDDSLGAVIATKVNISDTSSMLSPYIRAAGNGLTKSGQSLLVDTAAIATRARVQKAVDSLGAVKGSGTVTSVSAGTGMSFTTITTSGSVAADTTVLSTRAWRRKGLDSLAALELSLSDTASMLTPYTRGSGTTNYLPKFTGSRTFGNSQLFDNGTNVGISTANPMAKLDVQGIVNSSTSYRLANNAYTQVALIDNNVGGFISGYNLTLSGTTPQHVATGAMSGYMVDDIGMRFFSNTSQSAGTTATERMRITSTGNITIGTTTSGNVGIGTSTIHGKVAINGTTPTLSITNTTTGANGNTAILVLNPVDAFYNAGFYDKGPSVRGFLEDVITNRSALTFHTYNGSASPEGMRLTSSQEVLVNTTTDAGAYALQVAGSIYNTTGAVFAASSGAVGIGVTPQTWVFVRGLEIGRKGNALVGHTGVNQTSITSNAYFNDVGTTSWKYGFSSEAAARYTQESGIHQFFTAGTGTADAAISFQERMRVTNDGEVLIGTTSDAGTYVLQVSGAIYNTTTITTGAPTGGSIKPWRLGEAAIVSPTSPNRTIRVEIDGTVYYIHAKTTND